MCLSLGFTDAAAPIVVEGQHIANWVVGQYHVRDVDEVRIREYAQEIDVDAEEMVQAFLAMPKMTSERFENILSFLDIIANEISLLGYTSLLTRRQTDELQQRQRELEEYQTTLELRVAERTQALAEANTKLEKEIRNTIAVQQEQQKLLKAIEHVAEGIIITDARGDILYVNPTMERITGYSAPELLGSNPRILKSGSHDKDFYNTFWNTLTSGKTWSGRFINKRKDGTIYHEETTVSSVKDNAGQIIHYVAVKRDITKVLEMERQIQQMSKLEAVGTLAAGVAHEINTPIQYVTDNTLFLRDVLSDFARLHAVHCDFEKQLDAAGLMVEERKKISDCKEEIDLEYLETESSKAVDASLEGLERISTIVRAMKDFSHPGSQEKSLKDINGLIRNTVEVSRNEWKYNAEIEFDLDESIPAVSILAGPVTQVLLNVIINASQAIGEKEQFEKGTIKISTREVAHGVEIRIQDNGIGMSDSVQDKIFEPFFTTKPVGKGTGQGLALAYSTIVDGHGGAINVASQVGVGTEFKITLPLG